MSECKYPNLELLEYKVSQYIQTDTKLQKIFEQRRMNKWSKIDVDMEVFPQWWGSTCLGFDITPDGEPVISGQAITKAYTTIAHEYITDRYFVFFNNNLCYIVDNPNDIFLADVQKHNLKSLSEAKKVY